MYAFSMAYKMTTDHDEIRAWIEEQGGSPAVVPDDDNDTEDILTIRFKGSPKDVEEISWEEFFDRFDVEGLALRYPEHVSRDEARLDFGFVGKDSNPSGTSDETLPPDNGFLILENTYPSLPDTSEEGEIPEDLNT